VQALRFNNLTTPSGNVRIGDYKLFKPDKQHDQIHQKDFEKISLYKGGVQIFYLGDVATVEDGADVTVGYAQVNGKRSGLSQYCQSQMRQPGK